MPTAELPSPPSVSARDLFVCEQGGEKVIPNNLENLQIFLKKFLTSSGICGKVSFLSEFAWLSHRVPAKKKVGRVMRRKNISLVKWLWSFSALLQKGNQNSITVEIFFGRKEL
jgi:hypothetical protein